MMTPLLLQATNASPAPLLTYWREIAGILAGFGALLVYIGFAVFDKQFISAFDRCQDRIMNRLDRWYVERITSNAQAVAQVAVNSKRLERFEGTLMQQGEALQRQLGAHFTQHTDALKNVSAALVAVQSEAQATAQAVSRIEGVLEGHQEWDGANRRQRVRRKKPDGS
jgi:hypothetical protein